ncbi:MAG TPA: hypothetical protein VNX40_08280 [Mucilaginibacter sp.]|jgi:hypothetical protein|nr:hypothetical protein [Mucilaginibacter sp.]
MKIPETPIEQLDRVLSILSNTTRTHVDDVWNKLKTEHRYFKEGKEIKDDQKEYEDDQKEYVRKICFRLRDDGYAYHLGSDNDRLNDVFKITFNGVFFLKQNGYKAKEEKDEKEKKRQSYLDNNPTRLNTLTLLLTIGTFGLTAME